MVGTGTLVGMIGIVERGRGIFDYMEALGEIGGTHHLVKSDNGLRVVPNSALEPYEWSEPEIREEAPHR
ncbi:hypothetical protein [Enterovirga sp.]|uniref:hypothetical protein n=1 Tax=Enterovirga sp. TaxID=2026350 RepID=UPI00262E7CDF|nr:hypothetical protein [Enterovirga sp.]MDB5592424.1 hypothetical protein [Enterovirga sp.]